MDQIVFLTVDGVLDLHSASIERFGGASGVRDRGLLESAVLAPQQTFDGDHLYKDIFEMTAALWHGIVNNHPFIDGNKRTGALAADVFLLINGIRMEFTEIEIVEITLAIATGQLQRGDLAKRIGMNAALIQ